MIKKFFFILYFIVCLFSLWSISVTERKFDEKSFDSIVLLNKYFGKDVELTDTEDEFWNQVHISLITVSKEDPVYSWFGHQALLLEFPNSENVMFDYGHFAFTDDFYLNFAIGRLWYWCSASLESYEIDIFNLQKRSAHAVELNFTSEQKKSVVEFLYNNITEENRTYLYHYYKDNCATRIRDIIDYALDGEFKKWSENFTAYTYREETSRILYNSLFWISLLDFLQGSTIDKKNTLWEAMFLPENLEKAVLSYPDLAVKSSYLVDNREFDNRPANASEPQKYTYLFFIFGIILSLIILIFHYRKRIVYNIITSVLMIILGLLGSLLFFMMFFTSHDVTWWNENIIFINPLLLVVGIMSIRSQRYTKFLRRVWCFLFLDVVVLLFIKLILPTVFIQYNYPHILFVLPIYAVNFYLFNLKDSERIKKIREGGSK